MAAAAAWSPRRRRATDPEAGRRGPAWRSRTRLQGDDEGDDGSSSEKLQAELDVLLTQAARKRADMEKSKRFGRLESATERTKRISEMKSRMPCVACKWHGETAYGHRHSDKEYPYYRKDKPVLAVVDEDFTESDAELLRWPTTLRSPTRSCSQRSPRSSTSGSTVY